MLRKAGIPYEALHLHPGSHAGYYPGAEPIVMKVLFAPDTGRLLGVQAVGLEGVDKRIDVLATSLQQGMTVHDLVELELAYAPPVWFRQGSRQSGWNGRAESSAGRCGVRTVG